MTVGHKSQMEEICPQCGASFVKVRSSQIFCCKRCTNNYNNLRSGVTNQPMGGIYHCIECGAAFTKRFPNQKSCPECMDRKYADRPRQTKCVICGKPFDAPSAGKRFCSEKCAEIAQSRKVQQSDDGNREFYPGTIALIHKWYRGGDSITHLMALTGRSRERILEALSTPLTPAEEAALARGIPYQNRRRSSNGKTGDQGGSPRI